MTFFDRATGWLDRFSLLVVTVITLPLALAPLTPQPHVWEKWQLLLAGELTQAVDILDFFLHGIAWLVLGTKLWRLATRRRRSEQAA